jgi:hypothetical protein
MSRKALYLLGGGALVAGGAYYLYTRNRNAALAAAAPALVEVSRGPEADARIVKNASAPTAASTSPYVYGPSGLALTAKGKALVDEFLPHMVATRKANSFYSEWGEPIPDPSTRKINRSWGYFYQMVTQLGPYDVLGVDEFGASVVGSDAVRAGVSAGYYVMMYAGDLDHLSDLKDYIGTGRSSWVSASLYFILPSAYAAWMGGGFSPNSPTTPRSTYVTIASP